ncbi:hypothetical protein EGW08_013882 [Elysia chlorotica]|uniref:Neurotransmitter-gated ion-channel ligand-binding domain-containing protein n=1 Tax=Elysia chlorotica TaxID=188477 RepID=A0A433T9T7_ELYCH|nr:hypothetical protein EGW08_013882 [Elysia chlorotica]
MEMDLTERHSVWTVFCIFALCLPCLVCAEDVWLTDKYEEETEQTFELKFHKYNRWVRPPQRYVNVTVEMTVQRINYLDVPGEEMQTVIGTEMTWFDSRLSWAPIRVHQIMTNTSTVWTPDLVFLNSVSPTKSLLPGIVRIKKNGIVAWTRREVVTTSCKTQLNAEKQTCYIKLGFMSNIRERQDDRFIQQDKSFVATADDLGSHDWDLDAISLDFNTGNENVTSLPLQMDVEISVSRVNGKGRNSGNPSYSTEDSCSTNCKNFAARLFIPDHQSNTLLLFLIVSLFLVQSQ